MHTPCREGGTLAGGKLNVPAWRSGWEEAGLAECWDEARRG